MKKFLEGFLIVLISLQFLGCDRVYRLLQKEGAEEKDLLGETIPFKSNPKVLEVQKLLKLWGYGSGKTDGKFGPNTRTAIKKFQIDRKLKVTRFLDKATWNELNRFERYGLTVNGDLNMKGVQTALKAAKCDPGSIDGKGGRRTDEAIKKFQEMNGLKPDGRIGVRTLIALSKYLVPQNSRK
jgi:peptidoglycan hydrolase-like protein with peptidoglycan-binding domain